MRHILLSDQLALRAAVEEIDPAAAFSRWCPDCDGWGHHVLRGEGPLGTNLSAPCETCDGRGHLASRTQE